MKELSRRQFLKWGALGAGLLTEAAVAAAWPAHLQAAAREAGLAFSDGKYQTFPRLATAEGLLVVQYPDLGTLGPDVDTIFGLDFVGDIPTGAQVIYRPSSGAVIETRVVGIKRTSLETVQFNNVLGGDRFDVSKMAEHGGDPALDAMARKHAEATARTHQKVVYVGDLGLFQDQWGAGEKPFLQRIIRAQRPGKPELGIEESNFVNARTFTS